ncbi:MaoC family dehydratase [Flexivirga oryzae]|uniref:Acyl dehydratase n=1 Tax=Flexivirga oryzae TaxID=1794944 RepID=A0A839N753_9MICO|nr:acyl dehydratase [Flexivirga oryzae]
MIGSVAEAKALVGQPLGTSAGLLVDQARIDAFAEATGDHQWIHVDPERAASGPFGTTIAHGYLTLSLVPVLAAEIYSFGFGSARLNYGSDKVRFPQPVAVGSTLRATAEFTEVRRGPQGTFITTRSTVIADGAVKPACVAETVTLVVGDA